MPSLYGDPFPGSEAHEILQGFPFGDASHVPYDLEAGSAFIIACYTGNYETAGLTLPPTSGRRTWAVMTLEPTDTELPAHTQHTAANWSKILTSCHDPYP